jgi:hypothetical protein
MNQNSLWTGNQHQCRAGQYVQEIPVFSATRRLLRPSACSRRIRTSLRGLRCLRFSARCRGWRDPGQSAAYPYNFLAILETGRVISHNLAFGSQFCQIVACFGKREAGRFRDLGIKSLTVLFQVLQDLIHLIGAYIGLKKRLITGCNVSG